MQESKSFKEQRIRKITNLYYSNKEIQKAMFEFSKNREISPRYFEGFGKRPDSFQYIGDIFELVKKGATSFHCSEELWKEPLKIQTGMTEKQLNELRLGWDLLLDIDSKYIDYSKIMAKIIIQFLNFSGVKNVGIKFSGSKGFHILVPWKAFPKEINGIKTSDMFPEYPRIITKYIIEKTSYPGFLISSYDIFHLSKKDRQNILKKVSEITNRKIVTLLDNGNYEAYWYHDADWDFDKFKSVLTNITVDFSFSFDVFWEDCKDKEEYIQESISSIAKTAGNQKLGTTIPLIHSVPKMFPEVIRDIVDGINPEIIAVPERELGVSIFERVKTVKSIRQSLDDTGRNIPLHLLGTGNPISILVYTYYGADLYDGLEWCQTLINPKTMILSHFSHGDFIECRVWKGGSMMLIALNLLEINETNQKTYLYDTFEGMSKHTEDSYRISNKKIYAVDKWKKEKRGIFLNSDFRHYPKL